MAKKPIEYTAAKPLVISIERHHGVWDIHAKSDHHADMEKRLKDKENGKEIDEILEDEWDSRNKPGKPDKPHYKRPPKHAPILVREGEAVLFMCDPAFEFTIWAPRDKEVDEDFAAPGNPFGWRGPQIVPKGQTLPATITIPAIDKKGPREQRFYKLQAVIYDDTTEQTEDADPDLICDR